MSSGVSLVFVLARNSYYLILTQLKSFNQLICCNKYLHGSIYERHDLLHGFRDFFELNSYIFQGRPTLTASEEFLKNLDSEIKNLKIVEVETSTRFKFSNLSRSRLARD